MIGRVVPPSLILAALLAGPPAHAQATSLTLRPEDPGTPWEAEYSQGVMLRVALTELGLPVVGERVSFFLHPEDDPDAGFLIEDPLTDAQGIATARLTLVDGRHGGQSFTGRTADDDQTAYPYVVTARFAGDLDAADPLCTGGADAGPAPDGGEVGLCPSETTSMLFVDLETVSIEIAPGNRVALGESITLFAILEDQNGDAPTAGTDVDGDEAKPVEGATVSFFFDLDGNERPSLDERIGTAETSASGTAQLEFLVDPAFFPSGDFAAGLQVQFGGDQRYALAGAAGRITIESGGPDPGRTLLDIDPPEAEADGQTRLTVTAKLVDAANNLLPADAEDHAVAFATDVGLFEGDPVRDPLTGFYAQMLRAPDQPGTATVSVSVDGEDGATATVTFTDPGGCSCDHGPRPAPGATVLVLCTALFFATRRRR